MTNPIIKIGWLLKNQIWALTKLAQKFRNPDGYLYILLKDHPRLKDLLSRAGFFIFHSTNRGNLVGEHQIIAYLFRGGAKALRNGFEAREGEIEVHHYNSCPWDNRPENLQYLAVQDHKIITEYMDQHFRSKYEDYSATPFNAQGRPVKDSHRFLREATEKTMDETDKAIGLNIPFNPVDFLKNLPPKLYQRWQGKSGTFQTQRDIRRRVNWLKENTNFEKLSLLYFMDFVGFNIDLAT